MRTTHLQEFSREIPKNAGDSSSHLSYMRVVLGSQEARDQQIKFSS